MHRYVLIIGGSPYDCAGIDFLLSKRTRLNCNTNVGLQTLSVLIAFLITCRLSVHPFHIIIFFSRNPGPISTKLLTKYHLVKGIQVCSNERPHPFPRRDNFEIVKIH